MPLNNGLTISNIYIYSIQNDLGQALEHFACLFDGIGVYTYKRTHAHIQCHKRLKLAWFLKNGKKTAAAHTIAKLVTSALII